MWRVLRLLLVLAIVISMGSCFGSPRSEGPSAEAGDVRVTVVGPAGITGVAEYTYRYEVAIENLRSWTEFDGEFYLGQLSLLDQQGLPTGQLSRWEKVNEPDDLYADVISAGESVLYRVYFEGVEAKPAFLQYDSDVSGVLRVTLSFSEEP